MLPTQSELILSVTHFFKGGMPKPPPPPKPPLPSDAGTGQPSVTNRKGKKGYQSTILTQGMSPQETTKKTLLGM